MPRFEIVFLLLLTGIIELEKRKMKNGFAMMRCSDEPLGVCLYDRIEFYP
jgi:hypothetical protein